jgi:transmembrane sensor
VPPVTGNLHRSDPVWDQALGWLMRLQSAPDDDGLRAAHDAWLAESDAHVRAYRKAERVWRLTGEVPPAHAEFWDARQGAEIHRVGQSPRPPRRHGLSRRRVVGAAVGAIAACLALAVLLPDLRMRLQADYMTGVGERRLVALADGSSVHLDADSAIAVSAAPAARGVRLLAGQAFFEVAPDPARPFTVTAEEITVSVVGTAFDVQFAAASLVVAVESGLVEVEVSRAGRLTATSLAPGDSLTVDRITGAVVRDVVEPDQIASWRTGRLVVDGATVEQVVEQIRRYHGGAILLHDDRLGERRVTGVFDLHDPIGALRAVVEPHAGKVVELTPYLLLISAR